MNNTARTMSQHDECRREELIDGEIVMMSPSPSANHNYVSGNIFNLFYNYLEGRPCDVFTDPMDVYLSEKDRFIPDIFVVCDPDKITQKGCFGAPDLVVEILSYSTTKYDRGKKKDAYTKAGVREYWIVDTEKRSVEVYLLKDGVQNLETFVYFRHDDETADDVPAEFRCGIFPDLIVPLKKVFSRM